jgi:hypothetical protein
MTGAEAIALGRRVIRLETEALAEVEQRLGDGFARGGPQPPRRTRDRRGVEVGAVGRKIAAT